jgi:hypothetical protein
MNSDVKQVFHHGGAPPQTSGGINFSKKEGVRRTNDEGEGAKQPSHPPLCAYLEGTFYYKPTVKGTKQGGHLDPGPASAVSYEIKNELKVTVAGRLLEISWLIS